MSAPVVFDPRGVEAPVTACLPDLSSHERIDQMVAGFYQRLLSDEVMAPLFLDVARIDLQTHLPLISQYWYKMLLGDNGYQRHTMKKHRQLHAKQALTGEHHERWLQHFFTYLDRHFSGPNTDRAKHIAQRVMFNLYDQLSLHTHAS